MLFTLENDRLRVSVCSTGCEIVAITGKKDGCE